jgi:hypothetical protein
VKNLVEYKAYGGHALRMVVGITKCVLLHASRAKAAILKVFPIGCGYSSNQTAIIAASIGDAIL